MQIHAPARFALMRGDGPRHRGVEVDDRALMLEAERDYRLHVRRQARVFRRGRILVNRRGRQQHHADAGGLRRDDHRLDFLDVHRQGHAVGQAAIGVVAARLEVAERVPDVVDADADRHQLRLGGQHVTFEPRLHVGGLVPRDAGVHHGDGRAWIGRVEVAIEQPHVAARLSAALRDAVAERDDSSDAGEKRGNRRLGSHGVASPITSRSANGIRGSVEGMTGDDTRPSALQPGAWSPKPEAFVLAGEPKMGRPPRRLPQYRPAGFFCQLKARGTETVCRHVGAMAVPR